MDNYEVATVLDETADMLEVAGENFFRVRAYRNAARSIRDQTAQVADLSEEQIDEIPGIGADLAKKITAITKTGDMSVHHELASKFPPQLLELKDIPGLGPKRLKLLMDLLHIRDRGDLEGAVKSEALQKIRGFGPKIEERIRESLQRRETVKASECCTRRRRGSRPKSKHICENARLFGSSRSRAVFGGVKRLSAISMWSPLLLIPPRS